MTLRTFLQSFPLAIVGVDAKHRVRLWNRAAERLLGWPAADVVGKPDPSVPPEVAAEHKTLCDAALRGESALQRESVRMTRGGALLDVVISTATDGRLALSFIGDVTEHRAEEERLADRENQLRLMLEQLPAIISTFDHDLRITSVRGSGVRLLGVDAAAYIGKSASVIGGEDSPFLLALRAALRGESRSNEYEYLGHWYENRAEPLRRRDGSIGGAINIGFDVTERRRAEEAVRRLSAAMNKIEETERRRIARELHDELGQLLTSLRLDLGLMRRELRSAPVESLDARIEVMLELVDVTLGTVRRVATELRPSVLDDFGLRAALEHEASVFAERTGIDVRLSIRHDELIDADRATAVYRIVQESLTNVARHSGATRVDVRVDTSGNDIVAELRDNGRGITEAEVNSVSTLGLLGVRERAYALGGKAVIEAIPGDGTRVFVSLPQ